MYRSSRHMKVLLYTVFKDLRVPDSVSVRTQTRRNENGVVPSRLNSAGKTLLLRASSPATEMAAKDSSAYRREIFSRC
jgi:hypothetical protein